MFEQYKILFSSTKFKAGSSSSQARTVVCLRKSPIIAQYGDKHKHSAPKPWSLALNLTFTDKGALTVAAQT